MRQGGATLGAGFCHDRSENATNGQNGRIRGGAIVPALVSISMGRIVTRDDSLDMEDLWVSISRWSCNRGVLNF